VGLVPSYTTSSDGSGCPEILRRYLGSQPSGSLADRDNEATRASTDRDGPQSLLVDPAVRPQGATIAEARLIAYPGVGHGLPQALSPAVASQADHRSPCGMTATPAPAPESAGRVLIVTGPPGAGKSTVSRQLADRMTPSVHLHSDDFWHFIRQGHIAPYLPQAHHQNEVVIDVLVGAAFRYATGGYQVVLDGIVGPWFLDPFRTASTTLSVPLHYVVLRPDERTALARAAARGHEALTDPEPIRSLYQQFADLGELDKYALDSGNQTADETTSAVLERIKRREHILTT
jgi:adenylate kinase family enzyme